MPGFRCVAATLIGCVAALPPTSRASVAIVQPLEDQATTAASQGVFTSGVIQRGNLLGDMFGLRSWLGAAGITLDLTETSEVLGNLTGGVSRGPAYDGVTIGTVQIDSQRALGYFGGTLNISALQYHGRDISADRLLNLQTSSGIEADRATRLWELWYDQKFFGALADVKIGQQSLDTEYMVSSNALLFVNTMFGWPLVPSYDLPGGGPAYPLSAVGVRLRAQVTPTITLLGGVYNGSPTGRDCSGDPQRCNPLGVGFPLDGGQLAIGEVQYAFPANGDMVAPGDGAALAGSYKLGFWIDTERFADQRTDAGNLSLADPRSGPPRLLRNDWSVYGVMDQTLWQQPDAGPRSLGLFVRAAGAPADRNLVGLSVSAGLVLHEPIAHRDDDSLGVGVGYGKIGAFARGLDRDIQQQTGQGFARSDETFIEATYQYVPFDWWQIQPDLQYVFNPGAGVADPAEPGRKLRNELVIGLRTNIVF